MPNCFALYRKTDPEPRKAVDLKALDVEIANVIGVPVHDTMWCRDWYNSIGWMLAVGGKTFPEIRKALSAPCDLRPEVRPNEGNKEYNLQCIVHTRSNYHGDGRSEMGRAKTGSKECTLAWFGGSGQPDEYTLSLVPIVDYLEANF